MKKICIIGLFVVLLFTSGCLNGGDDDDNGDPLPVINYGKVNEVVNLINVLPLEITEDDLEELEDIRSKYEDLTEDEQELVYNYDILVDSEMIVEQLKQERLEQEARNELYNDVFETVENDLRALVPTNVFNSIDLPTKVDTPLGEATIIWATSDPLTVNNLGFVVQGRRDTIVTLTSTIILDDYRKTFTQNVNVRAINFAPLPKEGLVFAYTFTTAHGFTDLEKQTINVVNHCFATINKEQLVVSGLGLSDRQNIMSLRRDGIRVVYSILGYGPEEPGKSSSATRFSEAARTPQSRYKFAQSVVETVVKFHYDGVDIDWEYPGFGSAPGLGQLQDTQNYTLLIKEIHRQLKLVNSDYILSAAVPAGGSGANRFELPEVNQYLDFFHLMTYDMDSHQQSQHHSALYASSNSYTSAVQTVQAYINGGASPEKLIIGAAFYGREVQLQPGSPILRGTIVDPNRDRNSITYSAIVSNYLSKIEDGIVIRYWDDVAKAPYLHNTQTNRVVVYDDYESIQYKIEYLQEQGLGGIMFWQFAQDNTRTLIQSMYDGLRT